MYERDKNKINHSSWSEIQDYLRYSSSYKFSFLPLENTNITLSSYFSL